MFLSILRRALVFRRDDRGGVAALFAIASLPLLMVMGVGVDISQFLVMKQQLRSAADAAALNVAQAPNLSNTAATAQAQAFIAANYPFLYQIGSLQSVTVTRSGSVVVVAVSASMNTNFLKIVGYNQLGLTISSTASQNQRKMELALVLDNTGSMTATYGSTSGISGLKTAATTLVNTLFTNDPTGQYIKIAVVPFTQAVNVGTQYAKASWMDTTGAGSLTKENLNVPNGQGLFPFASQLKNASWGGCVRQRTEPYDLEDVAPDAGTPDTLFTPYFAPSEPSGFCNYYLSGITNQSTQYYGVSSYNNGTVQALGICRNSTTSAAFKGLGPNFGCPLQPIIRLTNSQTAILNEINAMQAYGGTVIPAGLMWGWHVISPNGPFGDGVAYTDPNTIKAIILLTDGQDDVQTNASTVPTNGFNQSIYSAYGYAANAYGGTHLSLYSMPASFNGVEASTNYNLDQKLIQLCNNIKGVTDAYGNPGRIIIYAIGFGNVIDSESLLLLQQCATNSGTYFYNPTSEALNATFQSIAIGLNQLRISR